jgi:hypothetical protein
MFTKIYFVLSVLLLLFSTESFAQSVSLFRNEDGVDFKLGDHVILTYRTAIAKVPDGVKKDYEKSGFIHPITSPSGQVLSRIQPPDHYHHYGIWAPWARATINGREVDFWNLADGKGRVDFGEILSMKEAGGAAELNVRQNHLDLTAPESERLAIKENLRIKVKSADKGRY